MAKKKDNSMKFIGFALLGVAALLFLRQSRKPYTPQQTYVPPRPQSNIPGAISQWVQTMVQVFGNVRELWQPGGPFYKPTPEVQAALDALRISPPAF